MTVRALATIEKIVEVAPIPDADAIERVRVRGWDVVTKRDEFRPGDHCVYFEVDSLLDVTDERFAFLAPRGVRTDAEGHSGHVLRTARLRGQVSQGLALPLSAFPEILDRCAGEDVTDALGILKWEPPIPAELAGTIAGPWPGWIPKTDEERIQNVPNILGVRDIGWVATEKIDGTSCTIFIEGDVDGVCSRNLNLAETPNTLWRIAREICLHEKLRAMLRLGWDSDRLAVQGEVFGEGIQGNPLKLKGQHFRIFNLVDRTGSVTRAWWPDQITAHTVPVLDLAFPVTLADALAQADGLRSTLAKDKAAEGVVWRSRSMEMLPGANVRASFKVISNRYLLKGDR